MEYLTHFVNGAIGGMAGIIASHPVDTIKSNAQAQKPIPRSIPGLYSGITPALVGMAAEKAIVFGSYENIRRGLKNGFPQMPDQVAVAMAGALTGTISANVVCPTERLKVLAQTGSGYHHKYILQFRRYGLFQGLLATYAREVPGFAIYFSTYEYLRRRTVARAEREGREVRTWETALNGGLSGVTAWIPIIPPDAVKTDQQSRIGKSYGFFETIRKIYAEGGSRAFIRGGHWAIFRAFPLHGGTFVALEWMKSRSGKI